MRRSTFCPDTKMYIYLKSLKGVGKGSDALIHTLVITAVLSILDNFCWDIIL